ncbi:SDR family oxidoreductase [Streptomyces sp. NPDC057238]|uniref:SDR family oxidoreductase n=1 Tax=Streptomyces sp. NPDC057238 TaxID=3346060 RepID=UPI0036326E5C
MSDDRPLGRVPVAVIGLAALLPGAHDVEQSWKLMLTGRDLMREIPPHRWLIEDYYHPEPGTTGKVYVRRGAFLPKVAFPPLKYGIPPQSLASTDSSQLLSLMVADRLLLDVADGCTSEPDHERTAVILGSCGLGLQTEASARIERPVWRKVLREHGLTEDVVQRLCDRIAAHYAEPTEDTFPGLLSNVIAGRIASRFDLHGTNHTTDAACASSLAAVSTALDELSLGRADLVITGGVDSGNGITMFNCFTTTPALSPSEDCRPFSEAADGTMLGEAVVMLALKRLSDAERDGDGIYAVVRGLGTSSDGRGGAIYTPQKAGQVRALHRAYAEAGYAPTTVELVEAHGTGTRAGDQAEFASLQAVFATEDVTAGEMGNQGTAQCALGSVKSQIGHTKAAAGAAGLLKAVLALHHKVLPPTIKVDRPHPALSIEASPFYLNTETRPWIRPGGHPRRAAVSSFGFGGSNFHCTLEEYPADRPSRPRARATPTELFLFSADSADELAQRVCDVREEIESAARSPLFRLADPARRSQEHFHPTDLYRLAFVAADADDVLGRLDEAAQALPVHPEGTANPASGIHLATGVPEPGGLAFLFPGQAAQYVGMGGDLAVHHPTVRQVWDVVGGIGEQDLALHQVVFPPPVFDSDARKAQHRRLTTTQWAQPAVAAHSAALLALLREIGLRPDCLLGHSLGELAALHAAGVFDAYTLVRLARERGEAMRSAAEQAPGGMLVVFTSADEAAALLAATGVTDAWIANHNGPRQTVISGTRDALHAYAAQCREAGVATSPLAADGAFHSPLMTQARTAFGEALERTAFSAPDVEVLAGADACGYPDGPSQIRDRLIGNLTDPVHFADQVEAAYIAGARIFIEVGPGAALTQLVGTILGDRPHLAVPVDRRGEHDLTVFQEALARLAIQGVALDYPAYWRHYTPPADPDQEQPHTMTVEIDGGNLGRHYPPQNHTAPSLPEEAESAASARPGPLTPTGGHPAAHGPAEPPTDVHGGQAPVVPAPVPPAQEQRQETSPATSLLPAPVRWSGWASLVEEIQRQTADAHADYQRLMTNAHMAFLRTAETSFAALFGCSDAGLPSAMADASDPMADPLSSRRGEHPAEETPPQSTATFPQQWHEEAEPSQEHVSVVPVSAPVPLGLTSMTAASPAQPLPQDMAALSAEVDPEQALLAVVAERTGYPVEMLNLDMDVVADLGIDSIKRVEILSKLRQSVGHLEGSEDQAGELLAARTLREITDMVRAAAGGAQSTDAPPAPARPQNMLGSHPAPAEAPPTRLSEPAPTCNVVRHTLRPESVPPVGLRPAAFGDGTVYVVDGGSKLGKLVAERLCAQGMKAEAIEDLEEPGPETAGVVYLGGLHQEADVEDMLKVQRDAFRTARLVAPILAHRGGLFVTVQDTGGDFGTGGTQGNRAWLSGLVALARTAAKEWPKATVKAIDCARAGRTPEQVADVLVSELLAGGPLLEVGLPTDGTRVTLRPAPAPRGIETEGPGPDDVIIATGGARGVTAAALTALAGARRPRLALLGRTRLEEEPPGLSRAASEAELVHSLAALNIPDTTGTTATPAMLRERARRILAVREIRATLAAIEEAGSPVRYFTADALDAGSVRTALDAVRAEWGPITGIVHGAGVLADKHLTEKTDAHFDAVFGTKVTGLRTLLEATTSDPLQVICVFTSVAACWGNPGQSDYAMANETLAQVALAEAAERPGCHVRALDWGPWAGGMVTPALADHFAAAGVPLLPLTAGAEVFVAEMTHGGSATRVILAATPAAGGTTDDDQTSGGAEAADTVPRRVRAVGGTGTGAPLLGGLPYLQPARVCVDRRTHPQLADHQIAGRPVLPVAQALEWMLGAARSWCRSAENVLLRDLRVFQPVVLDRLEDDVAEFTLTCRDDRLDNEVLAIDLRGIDDRLHYGCRAGNTGGMDETTEGIMAHGPTALTPYSGGDVYDGTLLFHGPLLRGITAIAGLDASGARGTVQGLATLGWPDGPWQTDPAAVDAALQLGVLWAREALEGAHTLPMAVGAFHACRTGPAREPLHCVVTPVEADGAYACCHIFLTEQGGSPFAVLRDVELIERPGKATTAQDRHA